MKIIKGRRLPFFVELYIFIVTTLLIPLAIVTVNNNDKLLQYSEAEIIQTAGNNLNSVDKLMELVCGNVITSTVNLSKDPLISEISNVISYDQFQRDFNNMALSRKISNKLKVMEYSDPMFFSLYFYLKDSDYIISTKSDIVHLENFYDMEWMDKLNESSNTTGNMWMARRLPFDISSGTSENEGYTNVVSFIHNTTNFTTNAKAVLVVNMYEKGLCNIMNNSGFDENSSVFIINEKGKVVSHMDKTLLNNDLSQMPYIQKILRDCVDPGYFIDSANGQRTLYRFKKSSFNNWIFVSAHSLDLLLNRAITLRNQTIFLTFGVSLIFFLAAYLFSRHMTTPIRNLIKSIVSREGYQTVNKTNEIDFLVNAFEQITEQEQYLNSLVKKNENSIKEVFLLHLLKGNVKNDFRPSESIINERENIEEFDLGQGLKLEGSTDFHGDEEINQVDLFPFPHFMVAVVVIDNQQIFNDRYTPDQRSFMRMLMQRKCEEIHEQGIFFQSVLYDEEKLAMILNLNTYDCLQTQEVLKRIFSELQCVLRMSLGTTVSIGVSGCHNSTMAIQKALSEALEALREKLLTGHESLIFWNKENTGKSRYYYPFIREKHIFNYLGTGNMRKIESEIHELVQEIRNMPDISCENIIQVFNQLISATIKYFVENNMAVSRIYPNVYRIYLEIAGKETLEDLEEYMIAFYKRAVSFAENNGHGEKSIEECVINYLNTNYRTEILFDKMAEDLKISYSYIRKIVKRLTGKSVLDYINSLRVNEGKRLLRQTNSSIGEIAQGLGYNNVQSFNRFFKKFEGITPGEFRSQTGYK